ncbi:hypothetical protein BJY04DRAFT_199819 [Aspergillus karnatakaensis]|uniref:uncharacterized protein n=1 Tax=Aspergillus karnatakaensis TaxID=1810916 RepID=UPI003CCCDB57
MSTSTRHLDGFVQLNSQVYLRQGDALTDKNRPTLIVLCAWMFAAPKHIQKYTQLYEKELPHATVLLIRPVVGDMIWTSDAAQFKTLKPAVQAINTFLKAPTNPSVRFHIFSNGGSHAAVQLMETFKRTHPSTKMSIDTLILDSCPGSPSAVLSAKAVILAVSPNIVLRAIAWLVIWIAIVFVVVSDVMGISDNAIAKTRRHINSPHRGFLRPDTRRVYLFSKDDPMVPWEDVLEHAAAARRRLGNNAIDARIQTVEFKGSGHVNHLAVDRQRYINSVFHS